jgi:hypothetical protein
VLLQNRNAFVDARITDIHGRAGYKTLDRIGMPAAERAAQLLPRRLLASEPQKLLEHAHILIPDSVSQKCLACAQRGGEPTPQAPSPLAGEGMLMRGS